MTLNKLAASIILGFLLLSAIQQLLLKEERDSALERLKSQSVQTQNTQHSQLVKHAFSAEMRAFMEILNAGGYKIDSSQVEDSLSFAVYDGLEPQELYVYHPINSKPFL